MKIVLIISIFGVAIFIGTQIYRKYYRRENFYKDLLSFCEISFSEINFLQTKIIELINKNIALFKPDFRNFLEEYKKYLQTNLDKEKFKSNILEKIMVLEEDEVNLICNFFCVLGAKDVESELGNINNFKSHFKEKAEKSSQEKTKYGNLYFKLSVMIATMLAVIII